MLKGLALRQKLLRNGSRQIISFHIPTEFVDLQNGLLGIADQTSKASTAAKRRSSLARRSMDLAERGRPIRKAMWIDTLIDSSIFREWVVNVGRRDLRARIAHLLCELALRLENSGAGLDGRVDFPITQEQLADATGLTAVHTNRTLQSLRRDGLVELSARAHHRRSIGRGLREVGDFDELYLHQRIGGFTP